MKSLNKISRGTLYILVLTGLHFFSQIFWEVFASHFVVAYIIAAVNGVIALESYYLIRRLSGLTFFRVYWIVYGVRVFILFVMILTYGALQEKTVMFEFFGQFFVLYFSWLAVNITILVAERRNQKKVRTQ